MRRLVLFIAAGVALVVPAAGQGAEPSAAGTPTAKPPIAKRAVAATVAATRAGDGAPRAFDVRVRGRASAVVVCDLGPVVCRVAERRAGRRWRVVLPSGSIGPGLPELLPGRPAPPTPVAGEGPHFRVAVFAYQGPRFTRREFGGRYLDA
jgi:hypothetical protein